MAGEDPVETSNEAGEIHPLVAALQEDGLQRLENQLSTVIDKRIDGIHYTDGRLANYANLAAGLIASGVALLPLSGLFDLAFPRGAFIGAGIASIVCGAWALAVFTGQTNYKYPFLGETPAWKWFYRDALGLSPEDLRPTAPTLVRGALKKVNAPVEHKKQIQEEFAKFSQRAVTLQDQRISVTQDLRQAFRLHVNEMYKNAFLTQMRTVFVWSLFVIVSVAVVGGLVALCIAQNQGAQRSGTAASSVGPVVSQVSWSATGVTRSDGLSILDVQYRFSGVVTSSSKTSWPITALTVEDSSGRPVPAQFTSYPALPFLVSPRSQTTVSGYFWVAASETRDSLRMVVR